MLENLQEPQPSRYLLRAALPADALELQTECDSCRESLGPSETLRSILGNAAGDRNNLKQFQSRSSHKEGRPQTRDGSSPQSVL